LKKLIFGGHIEVIEPPYWQRRGIPFQKRALMVRSLTGVGYLSLYCIKIEALDKICQACAVWTMLDN
jgi:hypothetical protein